MERELDREIVQGKHFDTPSVHLWGVNEHRRGASIMIGNQDLTAARVWREDLSADKRERWGHDTTVVSPGLLANSLHAARVAFADNRKRRSQRNLRAGKVSTRTLGRRVPVDDPRLFARNDRPSDKDYFVLIALDVSGSTRTRRIRDIKAAGLHMAELLSRIGVTFAVYAHSGTHVTRSGYDRPVGFLDIAIIKEPSERWSAETRRRLLEVCPFGSNLDGHAFEYYRKVADRVRSTDKIVMYFTDGAMPAANFAEELAVLQREIADGHRRRITWVGVGAGTDSPTQHGLDTIRLDRPDDIKQLIRELQKRITA